MRVGLYVCMYTHTYRYVYMYTHTYRYVHDHEASSRQQGSPPEIAFMEGVREADFLLLLY